MKKPNQFNLLFPEWQGYGDHQEVYHGAQHLCRHVGSTLKFEEVEVPESENLEKEGNIIGYTSFLKLLDKAKRILSTAAPAEIFMIGGTCACEMVPVSYLNQKYDNDLAVFWFDAHGDLNTPDTSPSGRLHGMPLRSLLGEGDDQILDRIPRYLNKEQVALVGSRDLDSGELSYIEKQKLPIFRPNKISHASELVDFARKAGFTKAYIHFDLDVLEPDEFPHVLVPVTDGLKVSTSIECLKMIRKNFSVVGCSIVEYCPKGRGGNKQLESLITGGLGISV